MYPPTRLILKQCYVLTGTIVTRRTTKSWFRKLFRLGYKYDYSQFERKKTLWMVVPVNPADIEAIVKRSTSIAPGDGYNYKVDRWGYDAQANAFIGKLWLDHDSGGGWRKTDTERFSEKRFLASFEKGLEERCKSGWSLTFPNPPKQDPFRTESRFVPVREEPGCALIDIRTCTRK